ncbi:hypothetical protein AB1Y20_001831 [Prymnesium parvum]|uniref:Uncharacterized protein n=1 Tax=Prymnesium parvum TaxID=97485 RepID=A0AB34K9A5_PRYPA
MPHASLCLAAPLSPLRPELQAVHLAARQLDASLVRHGGAAAAPDASRLASILAAAGLAEYAPLLPPPPPSLRAYVAEVCAHVGRLSLLPSLLAALRLDASHDEELWQLATYSLTLPPPSQLWQLATYSLTLHLLTSALTALWQLTTYSLTLHLLAFALTAVAACHLLPHPPPPHLRPHSCGSLPLTPSPSTSSPSSQLWQLTTYSLTLHLLTSALTAVAAYHLLPHPPSALTAVAACHLFPHPPPPHLRPHSCGSLPLTPSTSTSSPSPSQLWQLATYSLTLPPPSQLWQLTTYSLTLPPPSQLWQLATYSLTLPPPSQVWQLAHYSLALHLLTSALADDPRLFARVVASLRAAMRRRPRWWAHLTPFEHAKMLTVERTMEEYLAARREGAVRAGFGRLGLPLNILEAVLEDVRFGWRDNAMAGLALMRARPGQLGGRAALSRDGRRAVQMHLPLPEEWRDLYISWNLAFTSNYADSPFFAAAMLNPSVLGAEASEFMYYRALALYIHMAGQIIGRVEANAFDPSVPGQGQRDWRHPRLTAEWGALNLRAARRYEARRALCLRRARAEAWRAAWRRGAAWQSPKAWPSSRKGAPLRS